MPLELPVASKGQWELAVLRQMGIRETVPKADGAFFWRKVGKQLDYLVVTFLT